MVLNECFCDEKPPFKEKANNRMARAKRHYLPGHVWHITHRCHKKEFLGEQRGQSYTFDKNAKSYEL